MVLFWKKPRPLPWGEYYNDDDFDMQSLLDDSLPSSCETASSISHEEDMRDEFVKFYIAHNIAWNNVNGSINVIYKCKNCMTAIFNGF